MMERQVNHMVRLVDDLLEVSRITRGKIELRKELVEVAAIVRGAVETSRPLIEAAGHQLALSIPPEPLTLDGDPVRLTQVVANLLNNAAKYTDARRADLADRSARRGRGGDFGAGHGHGHSARDACRECSICSRRSIATPSAAQGGLGIGLTLVKSLVEMHGGSVEALSDGRGTRKRVRGPPAAGVATDSADHPATDARPSAALPPRRVLVVDDNRDAADSLGMLLKLLGPTFTSSTTVRTPWRRSRLTSQPSCCWTSGCRAWTATKWHGGFGNSRSPRT